VTRQLLLFLTGLMLFSSSLNAQVSVSDSSISMVMLRPSYGAHLPGGDMAQRFGMNQAVGMTVTYKNKAGWILSVDGTYIFGTRIDEPNLFSSLTTTEGTVIGVDGLYADIRSFQRGFYMTMNIGRLFPVKKPNPNCGFLVEVGAGFMQHKIKIVDKKNAVPALRGDYLSGYDRLTNGLALREFIGYLYVGNRRLVNFYGGVEMVQGLTGGRRDYYFNGFPPDKGSRLDLLFGVKVGWVIALFKEAPEKFYTY
jgi:hypothetical protein